MGAGTRYRSPVRHGDLRVFAPAAIVSLLLSPITAVWALAVGAVVSAVAWVVHRTTHGRGSRIVLLVALGVFAGALPYILAGVLASAFDSGAPRSGSGGG
jgi:hypothetical protein